jgi:threonine dehydrogenase-like Zn-dependent dehydrogenase
MGVLSGILLKKSYSVKTLIGVDINASRVERAEKFGFDFVSCADAARIQEFIRKVGEPDIVIEATGMASVFPRVMGLARLGGKIVMGGVPEDVVELSLLPIFRKELTVLGAKGPFPYLNPNGGSMALELLGTGDLPVHELVGIFSFDKAREAFDAVSDGTVLKGVLSF